METESLGKLVPRILMPYAQIWAERSGLTMLSRLLVDEQFRSLIEKYSDEFASRALSNMAQPHNGNNGRNGSSTKTGPAPPVSEPESHSEDLSSLQARVLALEAQQEMQQAIFEALRTKIRPLALALGSCPECLVGVEGCLKCGGRTRVGDYSPDYTLLEAEVVRPLVARGVPLSLQVRKGPSTGHQSTKSTAKKGA
jgi:hypothetical protein